jgi:2-alkyl-3-oxoalkanoate reductase
MRVFVAGASGALGSRLVPQLIDAGHEVIGTHHSPTSAEVLRTLGARPVRVDLIDPRAVRKAVLDHEPEAIVHEATALAGMKWSRNFDKVFAAWEVGTRRVIAQSFASYRYVREGGPIKSEDDPLDATVPANAQQSWAAMDYLDRAVTDFGGVVLRYGVFYGAATTGSSCRSESGSIRSSATAAASPPGCILKTLPRRRYSPSSTKGRRFTTSSTTSRRLSGTGCPSSRGP